VRRRDPVELVVAATEDHDRAAIARLISAIERGGPDARAVGRLTYPRSGNAYTVGVTGAPGAGKSTLTNRLIEVVRGKGSTIGVLAIDPSSPFSGGAILGDRVRMQDHALDEGVFIRSMATRGHLGGLALATPEAIRVLDAAGVPIVLVETVGVGQVEVEVAGRADTTIVVVNPGWGDAVQANKAGLLEVADLFVINKADRPGAREARRDLDNMLDMNMHMDAWRPPIVDTVASSGEGVPAVWDEVERHRSYLEDSGELEKRRHRRTSEELKDIVVGLLERRAQSVAGGPNFDEVLADVIDRRTDPYTAAETIVGRLGLE
jgi:LAO/AO transport system kinase